MCISWWKKFVNYPNWEIWYFLRIFFKIFSLKKASLVCNDNKLSRLGQLRRALATYIPAGSEAASRIILKRKDVSSVESWDECGIYDKV